MFNQVLLLLPNQLFDPSILKKLIPDLERCQIIIYRHPKFFTRYKYHKYKLAFHISTILAFMDELQKYNYHLELIDELCNNYDFLTDCDHLTIFDPVDFEINNEITRYCKNHKKKFIKISICLKLICLYNFKTSWFPVS